MKIVNRTLRAPNPHQTNNILDESTTLMKLLNMNHFVMILSIK